MNVAVADVAEGHRADARHHRLDQRRGARDELRHPGDGHRDVVLDGAALELLRLDDAFADGPERRGLARVGSERRVADQPVLDGCRQELLQALAQGAVGAAGSELDQHVPAAAPGERVLDAGDVLQGEVEADARDQLEGIRSEEHTSELQSLMRSSYAVVCLQKKKSEDRTDDNQQHKLNSYSL